MNKKKTKVMDTLKILKQNVQFMLTLLKQVDEKILELLKKGENKKDQREMEIKFEEIYRFRAISRP